jgi:bifunctional non-homologous end joining protein LigD
VEPEVVCEVRYKEWTMDGHLRLPVFLRLRDDKAPEECLRQEELGDLGDLKDPDASAAEEPDPGEPEATAAAAPQEALRFTRLDKIFWPAEGYTKGDLVEYYRAISPWILPYLRDRPLVVDRYPDGITGKSFFQKNAPAATAGRAGRIRTVPIRSEGSGRGIDYFLVDSEPALLELANLGAIPLHVWSSRAFDLDHPDWCILDLDPKQAPFQHVVRIAQEIHSLCQEIGLDSFPKTSGGSGLHVLLPLAGQLDHDQARQLGELLARVIVDRLPEIATTARAISARRGRVYVDALQNGRGKLLVAPFSVRPQPGATVSTPLRWPEVDGRLDVRRHTIRTVPRRFRGNFEDPLLPVLETRPDLSAILEKLLEQV